jgi:hypothetical protein
LNQKVAGETSAASRLKRCSLDQNAVAYPIDAKDSVVAAADLPKPTAGAGEPTLFASEDLLQIADYGYGGDAAVTFFMRKSRFAASFRYVFSPG